MPQAMTRLCSYLILGSLMLVATPLGLLAEEMSVRTDRCRMSCCLMSSGASSACCGESDERSTRDCPKGAASCRLRSSRTPMVPLSSDIHLWQASLRPGVFPSLVSLLPAAVSRLRIEPGDGSIRAPFQSPPVPPPRDC